MTSFSERFCTRRILLLVAVLLAMPVAAAQDPAPDRTVLITGANRGIGFEFVKQYAARGWRVIATTRDPASADELKALADDNENVLIEQLDLLDHPGIDALAGKYSGQPIDVLINNAGLMRGPDRGQMVGTIDYAEFDRFYRTNAMGPLKVSEAFYPHVKAGNLKVMAALTTGKGKRGIPVPGFTLYKTSKAALDSLQQEIALRWKNQGIKVVTLNPGRVLTHGEPATPGQATVEVEDSIRGMIAVIDKLTKEQSGQTISWDGERLE
ncbi:MAG: SDR family oxidoreductase [Gammaproteobacteria bacterium]|nr:SDR family oxidoreductase [Gammaproteobacteria bacterium]MDH5275522.1 SDR family oxidoreductase [Gammaproteobacteria bacterium]